MKNQREVSLNILNELEKNNFLFLDEILGNHTKNLDSQSYGFIKTVSYGTVRYKLRLDYIIDNMSKMKFNKIDKTVLNILRISLYQLIYMSHVEDFAIVNEGVNLTKKYSNKGSVGFVNGLLRNFLRNKNKFLKIPKTNYKKYLSIKYSFPEWLMDEIIKGYGEKDIESILKKFNEEPIFTIRTNTTKISRDDLLLRLNKIGYNGRKTLESKVGIVIDNPENIFNTEEYRKGLFYVQSESSQLVIDLVEGKYTHILDLCAAPGGKLTHIYEKNKGDGKYIGFDVSKDKLDLIRENIKRLGNYNISLEINDGKNKIQNLNNSSDLVIADVPCSALGLIRRYPDMKYSKNKKNIKSLNKIQKQILKNGSEYLEINGILIYSTCTFTLEENECIIDKFLNENKNYELIFSNRISPIDFDSDGFTINILKRIG